MATIGKSAKLYQERKKLYTEGTLRGPGPQIYLSDNAVNHLKLEAPLPLPKFQFNPQAPDGALTQVWPHGDQYTT